MVPPPMAPPPPQQESAPDPSLPTAALGLPAPASPHQFAATPTDPSLPAESPCLAAPEAEPWDDEEEFSVSPVGRIKHLLRGRTLFPRGIGGSTFVSTLIHAAAVMICMSIAMPVPKPEHQLATLWIQEEEEEEIIEPELTLAEPDEEESDELLSALAMSVGQIQDDLADIPEESLEPAVEEAELEIFHLDTPPVGALDHEILVHEGTIGTSEVHVEGAVDHITREIMTRLENEPLFVIWLMDESISLVEERQRVADRLERVYEEIGQGGENEEGSLLSAVVGFGLGAQEIVPPTVNGSKVLDGVRNVPVDESGVENVFSSVVWSVDKYELLRTRDQRNTMVVIWTDESGDDFLRLEEAVAICQRLSIP
ncbi:MAG: hypothetical protein N2C14_28400, partial [Planctomycetales bacterium]